MTPFVAPTGGNVMKSQGRDFDKPRFIGSAVIR